MGMFEKTGALLTRVTGDVAAVLLLVTVIANAAAVVFRYGVGQPLIWTEEVQRYLIVWVAFLGGTACLGRGEHLGIDLLTARLPAAAGRILRLVLLGLTLGFCAVLMWKGVPLALGNNSQVSPAARIPMSYPYLAVGVGGGLMLAVGLLRSRRLLAGPAKKDPPAQ